MAEILLIAPALAATTTPRTPVRRACVRVCVCAGRACVRLSPAAPGNGGDLALPPARSSRSPAARPPAPPRGGGHMDLGLLRAHGRTAADLEEGLDLDTAD